MNVLQEKTTQVLTNYNFNEGVVEKNYTDSLQMMRISIASKQHSGLFTDVLCFENGVEVTVYQSINRDEAEELEMDELNEEEREWVQSIAKTVYELVANEIQDSNIIESFLGKTWEDLIYS